ncbi:MAG: hypothetical protein Q7S65_02150 [Nanoarchaeota archaeon]|nr:hypothetical protein [Nanoarchaeota archaeon]
MSYGFLTKFAAEIGNTAVRTPQMIKKARNDLLKELREVRRETRALRREKKAEGKHNLHDVLAQEEKFLKCDDHELHLFHNCLALICAYGDRKVKQLIAQINDQEKLPSKEEVPKLQKELESWRAMLFKMGNAIASVGKTG